MQESKHTPIDFTFQIKMAQTILYDIPTKGRPSCWTGNAWKGTWPNVTLLTFHRQ